jgi:hypothetical protein
MEGTGDYQVIDIEIGSYKNAFYILADVLLRFPHPFNHLKDEVEGEYRPAFK